MQSELNRKDDGTIELTVTVPWAELKSDYDKVVEQAIKEVEVKGFRKGKAPRKIAEEKLDQDKVWREVLEHVIPHYYSDTIKKEELKPIISPQVQLLKAAPENDLVFKATTAEAPEVKLGNYRDALSGLKGRPPKIWTPKDADEVKKPDEVVTQHTETDNKDSPQKSRVTLDEVLNKLLKVVELKVPDILVKQQVNRELSRLVDDVEKLGMDIAQYAQSKGTTPENLRAQKRKEAEQTLKLEFVLEKIAEKENITVDDEEIEQFIEESVKDADDKEEAKKNLQNQSYLIASLIRRRKTLQNLL